MRGDDFSSHLHKVISGHLIYKACVQHAEPSHTSSQNVHKAIRHILCNSQYITTY